MSVSFNKELCDQNPYCPAARICPKGAMYVDRKTFRPTFDETKCTGCEVCISACPMGAIRSE
jgi:Fe-S-cluster-containing hydrogenase component 2